MTEQSIRTQLSIIKSTVQNILKQVTQTKKSLLNVLNNKIAQKNYQDCLGTLNGFCCKYEQELATLYLSECINILISNIAQLANSKSCPSSLCTQVSILCYSRKILHIPQLDTLIDKLLAGKWGKQEIQTLTFSDKVPDMLVHLKPRDSFTLEELHLFVHRFESEMNMDFTWFYESFPITNKNLPESVTHVQVLGRTIHMEAVQPPKPPEQKITRNVNKNLPQLPPFTKDSYKQLVGFVDKSLKGWNTWRFVV